MKHLYAKSVNKKSKNHGLVENNAIKPQHVVLVLKFSHTLHILNNLDANHIP